MCVPSNQPTHQIQDKRLVFVNESHFHILIVHANSYCADVLADLRWVVIITDLGQRQK